MLRQLADGYLYSSGVEVEIRKASTSGHGDVADRIDPRHDANPGLRGEPDAVVVGQPAAHR